MYRLKNFNLMNYSQLTIISNNLIILIHKNALNNNSKIFNKNLKWFT
ncbi:hypothetical protein A1OE_966 [Candidatus Endolissoclinum faulkneri L2]|uniref:Uncharacterized protein n=1 Tax=Candidatus Endolissoclinum faulkneri L2 TaxID=1193729 RepID=K7YNM9_9PROT|nr:hypothetical protein A1OE_966 [Candidatus Endolissoclinum faulkneri L2]